MPQGPGRWVLLKPALTHLPWQDQLRYGKMTGLGSQIKLLTSVPKEINNLKHHPLWIWEYTMVRSWWNKPQQHVLTANPNEEQWMKKRGERKKERGGKGRYKEQRWVYIISVECLLTLIRDPRLWGKWLNSAPVRGRGFLRLVLLAGGEAGVN